MNGIKAEKSLKKKSLTAICWSGADIAVKQGLQLVISVILARILGPDEYGTIALLYIFIELAGVFGDSGLSSALVQRQDLTIDDESTVFWFHIVCGLCLCVALMVLAPWVAVFYDKPVITPLMYVLALAFFITSLGSIHHVLLTKNLDFKRPMKVTVTASFFSGCVAVFLAFNDFGVWALAAQTLTSSIISSVCFWFLSKWRPKFVFRYSSVKRLLGFGFYLMLSDILMVSYNRFYTLYIGKVFSVGDLGIYSRADNVKQMPLDMISRIYARVAFPVFSQAAADKEKLYRGMRYALRTIMLVTLPLMVGLIVSAKELIVVLFGDAWVSSAPILEILALAGIFWPLHILNTNIQKALGYSQFIFNSEMVKKLLGIGLIILAMPYGIVGIAWSQVIYGFFGFLISAFFTGKHIGYGVFGQLKDIFSTAILSVFMGLIIHYLNDYIELPSFLLLLEKIIVGVVIFFGTGLLFRIKVIYELPMLFQKGQSA